MAAIKQYNRDTEATRKRELTYYSDFFKNFTVHPDKRDLARHVNEYSINESLKNIIFTKFGERFYNESFGCGVDKYLFENYSPILINVINNVITVAIRNFEKRVELKSIDITPNLDESALSIDIVYTILNERRIGTLSFLITRVR